MSRFARVVAGLMAFGAAGAWAQAPAHLDVFFVPKADIEFPVFGIEDDGDGFGVRVMAPLGESLAFKGSYQGNSYDGGDVSDLRLGLGFARPSTSGVFVEYAELDVDLTKLDGFALRGRLATPSSDQIGIYGELAWLQLDDDEFEEEWTGLEIGAGITFPLQGGKSFFIDARKASVELDDDSSIELVELLDIRVGLRVGL